MKRAAIALFTAATLVTAGACSHETEPAPDPAVVFAEAMAERNGGDSHTIVANITLAPPAGYGVFRIREEPVVPDLTSSPDNQCGTSDAEVVLSGLRTVITPYGVGWNSWIAVPDYQTHPCRNGHAGWVIDEGVNAVSGTASDGTILTWTSDGKGHFEPSPDSEEIPSTHNDFWTLGDIAAFLERVQNPQQP